MEHEHSAEAISERLSSGRRHSYLRDWVYGGIDGSVTTFAVVAGVVGAQLSPGVILVIGIANIFADGFSMAASNFLGTKTEHEEIEHLEEIENRHIDEFPDGEREEVRQIFKAKGFEGEDLERVTEMVREGDVVRIDIAEGVVQNLRTGQTLRGARMPELLLDIIAAGGLLQRLRAQGYL